MNRYGIVVLVSVILLAACGDDGGSNADEKLTAVSSIYNLGDCTDKLDGDTVFVKAEKADFVCLNGKWTNADSLGPRIRKNDEKGGSAYVQPPIVAIDDKSISGVSQKGPFVTGSVVKLYELDGKTFAQTGKSFTGKITTDDGKFSVSSITLASQYALLEANGYFRNEIKGGKSNSPVILNALTDLSDRKTVNINLLTHLEYERALYLVNTGINLSSAKKQAEAEILNAFGIKGEFSNSEDLDIFSKGNGNAVLLAFSVLMLSDLSEADLTELLSNFATDIKNDGSWDDEVAKARIADWAQMADLTGELASIRSNTEKWNLGTVPEFEKYVQNFWYTNYGLGECRVGNKAEVKATTNEHSDKYGTQTRYICKDGVWIEAMDIEKDFYKSEKTKGEDGELWTGLVTGKKYKYDETQDRWFSATHNDTTLKLMGCTTNRNGEIGQSATDNVYYVCKNMDWQKAKEIDHDTNGEKCTSTEVGKMINGKVTATNMYYCTTNGWVILKGGWSWDVPKELRFNPDIAYGTMTDERDNKVYKTVKIGSQTWMAENLNYADSITTPSLKGKNWCHNGTESRCDVTGRLYTWAAAIDSVALYDSGNGVDCGYGKNCTLPARVQGVCPPGWHLPTSTEWNALIGEVGGDSTAGKVLKSLTGWYNGGDGTDAFGFSALPGEYSDDYEHLRIGEGAVFWSASDDGVTYAPVAVMGLYYAHDNAGVYHKGMNCGLSVRCLKN